MKLLTLGVFNMILITVLSIVAAIYYINKERLSYAASCILIAAMAGWLGSAMAGTIKILGG